jgi:hypothetical protein
MTPSFGAPRADATPERMREEAPEADFCTPVHAMD